MINLVKPYIANPEKMMPEIQRVLYSGYIASGKEVTDLEETLRNYIGSDNFFCLNSGTAALHIALILADVKEGDEVISTAMTAEPTNTTIALTGAKIVWADVDPKTGLINPNDIEQKITSKTKAIMVVHYAGMVCDMDKINLISKKYNIPVIEDAAHAFGSGYNGKKVGCNSKYTCFSFQAIKLMTTVDGGGLIVNNATEEELERVRRLRWFGLDKKTSRLANDIKEAGYKYSMNNVNAVIGKVQMEDFPKILSKHISNGKFYDQNLKGIPGIQLVPYYEKTEPAYWLYTLRLENKRDEFIAKLKDEGIEASPLHHRSDTHSVFASSKCELRGLDDFYSHFVHIPCGWWVSEEDRQHIVEVIKRLW